MTTATAHVGPMAVPFPLYPYDDETPGAIAFACPVQLHEEDLVAALWRYARVGVEPDELEDLDYVREVVAELVVTAGLYQIQQTRRDMAELEPGSETYAWLQEIRDIVRRAFASVLARPKPSRRAARDTARRELAGMAGAVA